MIGIKRRIMYGATLVTESPVYDRKFDNTDDNIDNSLICQCRILSDMSLQVSNLPTLREKKKPNDVTSLGWKNPIIELLPLIYAVRMLYYRL